MTNIFVCMNTVLFLGILLVLGLLATRLTAKIKLPNVTAFLVIGLIIAVICIIVDNSGYKSQYQSLTESLTQMNTFVSSVALGFIALSIGEEFKLSKLKQYGKSILIITLVQALLAVILVDAALLLVCYFLKVNMSVAICLGAIAAATAPAATLMVINQYKAKGPLVDILLPVVAFDDAVGLIVFSISMALSKLFIVQGSISFESVALIPLINIFGSLIVGLLLGILMHFTIKLFKSRNNHMIIIIAFTLLGVGACQAFNTIKINGETMEFSSLLTCMMIGAVYVNIAKSEEKPIITRDLELMDRWTPFLFTLFFVLSGGHLATSAYDIFTSSSSSLIIPLVVIFVVYFIVRSAGKYFGAFIGCQITHQEKPIRNYLGLTLLPQAGVAIGMANTISSSEIYKQDNLGNIIVTVVLCATLVYELFGPLITKWSLKKVHEIPEENL